MDSISYLNLGRDEPEQPRPENEDFVTNGIPKIRVMGVGGAGNNAINRMIQDKISSVDFIAVNTDAQVLIRSLAPTKIQIGAKRTKGLGAGADPEAGREAAEESKDQLARAIEGSDLLFITAGMGGGTGTGAAPVIAKLARDRQILTVAVVTEPMHAEGRRKMENALKGIEALRKYVDTLVIVPNENIRQVIDRATSFYDAYAFADEVLRQGIRGIVELIVNPGLINCDFADVRTVLKGKGLAHMGVGVAKGDNRITEAVKLAVSSPLLTTTIEGATGIIINFVGGQDLTYDEVATALELIHGVVDYNALVIHGVCIDPTVQDEVEVTVIATGFPSAEEQLSDAAARQQQEYVTPTTNRPPYPNTQPGPYQGGQYRPPVQPIYPPAPQPAPDYSDRQVAQQMLFGNGGTNPVPPAPPQPVPGNARPAQPPYAPAEPAAPSPVPPQPAPENPPAERPDDLTGMDADIAPFLRRFINRNKK